MKCKASGIAAVLLFAASALAITVRDTLDKDLNLQTSWRWLGADCGKAQPHNW